MVKILINLVKGIQSRIVKSEHPAPVQVHLLGDIQPSLTADVPLFEEVDIPIVV